MIENTNEYNLEELYHMFITNNKIPNEKRFLSLDKKESRLFFPLDNSYPTKILPHFSNYNIIIKQTHKKEWFENKLKEHQMIYAVRYLQVEALSTFIIYEPSINLFAYLFDGNYPYQFNKESYLQIAQILIKNYLYFTDKIKDAISYNKNRSLDVISMLYGLLPNDNEIICRFCLITEPSEDLFNPCDCTTPIHYNCLALWITDNKYITCEICTKKYK